MMQPSAVLGRIAMALILPAFVFPITGWLVVLTDHRLHPAIGHHPDPMFLIANGPWWILLGSMTLNAVLIISARPTRWSWALPRGLAVGMLMLDVVLAALATLVVLAQVLGVPRSVGPAYSASLTFLSLLAAALSVLVFLLAREWRRTPSTGQRVDASALLRASALSYMVAALSVVIVANIPGPAQRRGVPRRHRPLDGVPVRLAVVVARESGGGGHRRHRREAGCGVPDPCAAVPAGPDQRRARSRWWWRSRPTKPRGPVDTLKR